TQSLSPCFPSGSGEKRRAEKILIALLSSTSAPPHSSARLPLLGKGAAESTAHQHIHCSHLPNYIMTHADVLQERFASDNSHKVFWVAYQTLEMLGRKSSAAERQFFGSSRFCF
ncbi:hypothetical protein E3U43_013284, partial [Larimichthys crocea]